MTYNPDYTYIFQLKTTLEINTDALEVTQLEKLKKSLGIDKIIQMIDEQEVRISVLKPLPPRCVVNIFCHYDSIIDFLANSYFVFKIYHEEHSLMTSDF